MQQHNLIVLFYLVSEFKHEYNGACNKPDFLCAVEQIEKYVTRINNNMVCCV